MASAVNKRDSKCQGVTDPRTSGKLCRQQRTCQLGKIFYRAAGEPDTGESVMGIFKEETARCIFILKDKECRKKADEINRVGGEAIEV